MASSVRLQIAKKSPIPRSVPKTIVFGTVIFTRVILTELPSRVPTASVLGSHCATLPVERGRGQYGRTRRSRRVVRYRPVVGDARGTARTYSGPLRPLGSQGTSEALPRWASREGRAQERLADGRVDWGGRSAGRPAPVELGEVGRGCGTRRSSGVRRLSPWRRRKRRAHRGRVRLFEEGRA